MTIAIVLRKMEHGHRKSDLGSKPQTLNETFWDFVLKASLVLR